ncbi:uncharacterized protein LOC126736405 isoform X2 [Anthonomus grandis grandis]|uniref:uncharacterized protein LOC126736405 isoform X2 n=1 Tax=Anthonomus grandis grandis TaxID=2921223 RepID=UPI002165E42D|nr:uncharacterized protein LOC126736405 isoform X2 [Anthonomus grandis grandis]
MYVLFLVYLQIFCLMLNMDRLLCFKQPFLTSLEDALIDELKCPYCYQSMFKPIYHCARGHSLCSNCYEEAKICKSCGSFINGNRSYHLERISELVTYHCKYFGDGCQKRFAYDKLKQHENECQTMTFKCPLRYGSECKFIGNKKQILFHCQLVHADFTFVSTNSFEQRMLYEPVFSKYLKRVNNKTTFQNFYLYYTNDVLFQGVVRLTSTHIIIRMYRVSPPSETDLRYNFLVKLYDLDDNLLALYQEDCLVTDGWEDLTLDERGSAEIHLKMFRCCTSFTVEFSEYPNEPREMFL